MSIVIRPSPAVFRRAMPLVLVFGAYRRFEVDTRLDRADFETITRVVQQARRLRMPLAFMREVPDDRRPQSGVWLPGCQPRVTDRVFHHTKGSGFLNAEFLNVFMNIAVDEVYAVGPRSDSSMEATVMDEVGAGQRITAIIADHPLQKCSTVNGPAPSLFRNSPYSAQHSDLPLGTWERAVCSVEYQG